MTTHSVCPAHLNSGSHTCAAGAANQRLLPLHDLYENAQKFGTVIAAIPQLLSCVKVKLSGVIPAQPGYSVEPPQMEFRDLRQQQQPQQPCQGMGSQLAGPAQTVQCRQIEPTVKAELEVFEIVHADCYVHLWQQKQRPS